MDVAGNKILDQQMTRKEFVIYLAMGMASIFGIKNFIDFFTGTALHHNTVPSNTEANTDYGNRKYGA
jgi:hypothetical protein